MRFWETERALVFRASHESCGMVRHLEGYCFFTVLENIKEQTTGNNNNDNNDKKVILTDLKARMHQQRSPPGTQNLCNSVLVWQQAMHTRFV